MTDEGRVAADAGSSPVPVGAAHPGLARARASPWCTWGRRALTAALIVLAGLAAYQHRSEIAAASGMLGNVRAGWLLAAIAAEVSSMVVFARLQRWLLRAGGVTVGVGSMVEIVLAGNAMSTSLPGGAAWAAAWVFGQLRRRGANRMLAGWVLLVAGALSSFAIFVIVAVGSFVAGSHGPVANLRWVAAVLASIPVACALGVMAARRSERTRHVLATAWRAIAARSALARLLGRFTEKTVGDLGLVRPGLTGWAEAFALALANWLFDAACLVACIDALALPVSWRGLLVIYGLTQISASLPVTPGGLGVVEASMAALLVAYGSHAAAAFAIVLLYRIVSFWGLVPVGWAAWVILELARRGGVRRRPHPWAVHNHDREVGATVAAVGPERVARPTPCADCAERHRPSAPPGTTEPA